MKLSDAAVSMACLGLPGNEVCFKREQGLLEGGLLFTHSIAKISSFVLN